MSYRGELREKDWSRGRDGENGRISRKGEIGRNLGLLGKGKCKE